MHGATSWSHDATVEWRGASAEVCCAAVLLSAQLGQSCVTGLCRRVTRLCSCVTQLWSERCTRLWLTTALRQRLRLVALRLRPDQLV
ncbi:hypothetical protein JCGZ_10592 [Jatropha curcas]|uniref:Uncharacterized protein n=1 Tax=Jatropha curcas TaxID=180498 RepID=A0A067JBY1_JATCU|nr:hypothetical protein JCGZ_10592 [Jatropha curcas]